MFNNRFKRFGGEYIVDIIEYVKAHLIKYPNATITIGCDSIQKRRKTVYAITVMLYDGDIRNGAHVVFFRESFNKIYDNQERLYKEAHFLYEIGNFFDKELSKFYKRKDLSDLQRKKYKFHLLRCDGKYSNIESHREEIFIKNLVLSEEDNMEYKLVDLHVDFNPKEFNINERGKFINKSYSAYKSYVPWLRGMGFRVWAKSDSHAATTAADLLLKD